MKPLCIELFAGTFGWGAGFIAEGFDVVGFDIMDVEKELGVKRTPGCQLVLQDVLTLDGSQFRNADCIVASPPCTEFSYRGRYGRKKQLPTPTLGIELFNACYRIAKEANLPIVIENVVWAQAFMGLAKAHWGSQYLWGDVPPMLPYRLAEEGRKGDHTGLRSRMVGSTSLARKRMTAELSKIPFPLANWIARVYKP